MILLNIYIIITLISICGWGSFIKKKIFFEDNQHQSISFYFFYGLFLISIISILINFFLPLKIFSNYVIILGIILFFVILKKNFQIIQIIKFIIPTTFICFMLIYKSSNVVDFGMYHLPYISTLINEKISFGIANLHFRYAHTSIIQNISAIYFYNQIEYDSFAIIPGLIYSVTTYLIFQKIIFFKNNDKLFLLIFSGLILSFILLRFYRYNDFGNDVPAHLLAFLSCIIFFEVVLSKKNLNNFILLIIIASLAFFSKISLLTLFILPLSIVLFKKIRLVEIINFKFLSIFFIFFSIFFIKNIIISGCAIYPAKITCIESVAWYPKNYKDHANVEKRSFELKYRSRGYSDYSKNEIDKKLSKSEYIQNFNWVNTWFKNNFLNKTLKNILIFCFFVSIFFLFNFKYFFKRDDYKDVNSKYKNFFWGYLTIGILFWFFTVPNYRYGVFYIFMPLIFYLSLLFNQRKKFIINFVKFSIFFSFIFISFFNFKRILSNKFYYEDFLISKNIFYNTNIEYKKISLNNNNIVIPKNNNVCWYTIHHCTHFESAIKKLDIETKNGFKFYIPK